MDHIDATYRTIPDRGSRGITGCEMGGDGAMVLALKHPDVFSVVVPASGLNGIMIFHGQWDKATPVEMAREFDRLLTDRGVDHAYLEVKGWHCDFGYQGYGPVLKFLSDHLAGDPAL